MFRRVVSAIVLAPMLLLVIIMYLVGERKAENGRVPVEIRKPEPFSD